MSECLNKEVFDSDQRSAVLKGWLCEPSSVNFCLNRFLAVGLSLILIKHGKMIRGKGAKKYGTDFGYLHKLC